MNFDDFVQFHFPDATVQGAGFRARCPAHDDRSPSLSIDVGDDERILLYCHAGCTYNAILFAAGIDAGDMTIDATEKGVKKRSDKIITGGSMTAKNRQKVNEKCTATFEFYDADGAIVATKRRYDYDEINVATGEVERGKRFVVKPRGTALPLYELPAVLSAAKQHFEIWLVEGEGKADLLNMYIRHEWGADAVATSYAHWKPEFAGLLRGAGRIVLYPDLDEAGRRKADRVIRDLQDAGITNIVERDISSLFEGGERSMSKKTNNDVMDVPVSRRDEIATLPDIPVTPAATAGDDVVFIPTWENRPPHIPAVVSIHGTDILHSGNIGMVTAQMGAGKSALCEGIAAARLNRDADTFGIAVATDRAVLYIDTERSREDHWRSWERVARRAGIHAPTPLDGVEFENWKMIGTLKGRADRLRERLSTGSYGLVIVDGLGDLVSDTNDLVESQTLLVELCAMAESHDVAVMVTLHENPGMNDKPRGHLGSELLRRAECALSLQYDKTTGIRVLTMNGRYGKNRNDSDGVETAFVWSDDERMFVGCAPPSGKEQRRSSALVDLVDEIFSGDVVEYTHAQLVDRIRAVTSKSERTAIRRINDSVEAGLLEKTASATYRRVDADMS